MLTLRRFTADDAALVVALNADPEVMRHLGPTLTAEESRAVELPRLTAEHGELGYFAVFEGEEFVGWFCAVRDGDEVTIGYRLVRGMWGRGHATEGARRMVELARASGARRVTATTMAVNTGSRRVLEKAGLRHVRTWFGDWDEPLPGAEHGDVDYALEFCPVPPP